MVLSGLVPMQAGANLPAWMYHAQLPPPDNTFDATVPGLTWVDLVFPFFLFAMGAAIPLALTRRLERGAKWWQLTLTALTRGVLLLIFAVYVQHLNPWTLAERTTTIWLGLLLAFALLFPALMRLPKAWPAPAIIAARAAGWLGGFALLFALHGYFSDDRPFFGYAQWKAICDQRDIIIAILANTVVTGSLIWLLTRHSVEARLGVMFAVVALILASSEPGWVKSVWSWNPLPLIHELFQPGFQKYLLIVLPGTLAGDLLLAFSRRDPQSAEPPASQFGLYAAPARFQLAGLTVVLAALIILVTALLQARQTTALVIDTLIVAVVLIPASRYLLRDLPELRRLLLWGFIFLLPGLVFEPFEGGIKKDPSTLSYFFITSGLSCWALVVFTLLIDQLGWRFGTRLLVANGQNPMIAYAGQRGLLYPIEGLIPYLQGLERLGGAALLKGWSGALIALGRTLWLALVVQLMTKLRIYWRT